MFLSEIYSDRFLKKKEEPSFHVLPPGQMNRNHLELIRRLIVAGGQIVGGITQTLRSAKLIAFVMVNDEIVSVRVLKLPDSDYRDYVFDSAGADSRGYDTELGYAYTNPDYRQQGFSRQLLELLLNKHRDKLYATIREQNRTPQQILSRFGFKRAGQTFVGPSGANITLWVRR